MRTFLFKTIAFVCLLAIVLIMSIQIADAGRYVYYAERWIVSIVHLDGDVTFHVVKEDAYYTDHESQGSHQHAPPELEDHDQGTYDCPANSPSQCYYCGEG